MPIHSLFVTQSGNYNTLRKHVKQQFIANKDLSDPDAIDKARSAAIAGITNYMLYRAGNMINPTDKYGMLEISLQMFSHSTFFSTATIKMDRNIFEEAKQEKLHEEQKKQSKKGTRKKWY